MSENEETATALDRIRGWREEYRLGLAPSPLEDVTQLSAQLDLTHAHTSGIAQLFAKGHVTLDSLFRDNGMLRAAGRRVERVLDDRDAKSRVSGVGELSLVVGVAIWKGNQMPVLMYPVEVRKEGRNIENGTVIAFTGRVRLNAAFAAVMMCRGSRLNTRPVARPLRPKILFLYSFVPLGTLRIICAFLASDRPALWSKEKNQYTQPGTGGSRIISAISRGVSRSHSGSGLDLLIYSAYTGRFGLSGFSVASR